VVTVTDATPGIIATILTDPRTDHDSGAATSTAALADMAHAARATVNSNISRIRRFAGSSPGQLSEIHGVSVAIATETPWISIRRS
jgi:hypothetical protein